MATEVAHLQEAVDAWVVIRHLHELVTYGPGDLDIASVMSAHGYDAVKWAEGQGMLAELVSCEPPVPDILVAAGAWCKEASAVAQHALASRPRLLAKLGLAGVGYE
jgi:hypothetical protein